MNTQSDNIMNNNIMKSGYGFRFASSGLLVAGLCAGMISGTAKGDQLYQENFARNASSPMDYFAWHALLGATAADFSSTGNTNPGVGSPHANGSDGKTPGLVQGYFPQNKSYYNGLIYTTVADTSPSSGSAFVSFNPVNYTNLQFSWDQYDKQTTSSDAVAIQIGGVWYVSATSFSVSTIQTWETKTFDFTTAANSWYTLSVTPGSSGVTPGINGTNAGGTLSLGSLVATALPSGQITGVGLYVATGGADAVAEFDNFTITGTAAPIPEPASAAMIAGLAIGVMMMGRAILLRRSRRIVSVSGTV